MPPKNFEIHVFQDRDGGWKARVRYSAEEKGVTVIPYPEGARLPELLVKMAAEIIRVSEGR